MKTAKIAKLRRRIDKLRAGKANVRSKQLKSLAKSVGRDRVNRGKEPTFELDGRPPLTIPDHPGAMAASTVDSILDFLEEDLDHLETEESTDD